jgi:AAA15 family ATPase/GTPase
MRIVTYECREPDDGGWHFSKVPLRKVNLLVGNTASGKTRFLNTIFNIGRFVAADEFKNGCWDFVVQQKEYTYRWKLTTDQEDGERVITSETLLRSSETAEEELLIERDANTFQFKGKEMPKMSRTKTGIALLQEEESIHPLYEGFRSIRRRSFFSDELQRITRYEGIPQVVLERLKKSNPLKELFFSPFSLNSILYALSEYSKPVFAEIRQQFKAIFPFVTHVAFRDIGFLHKDVAVPGVTPIFCIQEKNVEKWVEIGEMSSGMQKVLLILTDMHLLPEGAIYLIDEYENSLGINAIDFFPPMLISEETNSQFIITSHHPYIINQIPMSNWFVFHRKGSDVSISYGEALEERYGKSKQEAFIKLINDPLYRGGVE